ncbi:hypothetical protein DPMN_087485 [Dreissena polymorpha]|uniref:Uncharacterized protein n=1 Tax=Dreissena polymorpha TaxID=45954 RepID=A0A9D4KSG9_DREPO|nr:hypothetical protein DPMN_087485 [Dreissena polymorpha]
MPERIPSRVSTYRTYELVRIQCQSDRSGPDVQTETNFQVQWPALACQLRDVNRLSPVKG